MSSLDQAQGLQVAAAFSAAASCDRKVAGDHLDAAVKRTGDVESLVVLARAAIDAGLTTQVHGMLEQIPDYAAREETARGIGAACTEDPEVLTYVLGLHSALRDRAFVAWSGAIRSCRAEELTAQLEKLAGQPPANAFDDKYATIVDLYAGKRRVEAIPVLEKAAIASSEGGPFPVVVDALVKAGTPEGIGTRPEGAAREALVGALVRISAAATPEQVTVIADKLVAMGAEDAAAKLLVHIYPDRVQADGGFVYGVAGIETCEGEAVLHWAVVKEPGTRWAISRDVETLVQGFPRRLKCKDTSPYVVVTSPGPAASPAAVSDWAMGVAADVGPEAKVREESGLTLL
jgi:hypothetical protein